MAQTSRPTVAKRQLESKRRARRLQKEEKRARRKQERQESRENSPDVPSGVDPDIADIVPGPQPPRF